jgi:hypothetical protein
MKMLMILTLLLPLQVLAWNCNPEDPHQYDKCMKEIEEHLSGEVTCDPTGAPAPENQCEQKYNQMFSDGTFNITLANGYFDSSPSDGVYGEYWNNRTIESLTAACPSKFELLTVDKYSGSKEETTAPKKDREHTGCGQTNNFQQSCGFTRTDNPEILQKRIMMKGKVSVVKVRIITSALTMSDKENRASISKLVEAKFCPKEILQPMKDACVKKNSPPLVQPERLKSACVKGDQFKYQICKSEYAKQAWKDSIKNGDEMVVYSGHARDGGGPSLEPPKILKNGHVNYSWYRKNREGNKVDAGVFADGVNYVKVPGIYGSMSCNGHSHFYKHGKFPKVSPSTAYVLSKRTSFPDEGVASLLTTIEGALNRKCGNELDQSITGASCAFKLYNF